MHLPSYSGFSTMNTQYLVAASWRTVHMWENWKLRELSRYQPAGILNILQFSTGPMEDNMSVLKMYISNL